MPRLFLKLLLVIAGSALAFSQVRASDIPGSYVIDLPFQANAATPSWLGHPEAPATTFATLNLPIQPPDATSYLLVTLFFQEKSGGFLRLNWNGPQGAQSLSDNFYEGINMGNQRSLLVTPDTLQGGGTLTLQCGDSTLGVQRIRLQWLENRNGLVSPEMQDTLVTPALGATQPAQTLNGQPAASNDPAWKGHLVDVPLTDTPQRIEQGVEFSVQLDEMPTAGRLILKENGLPWGKHLVVWIDQQRAGTMTPVVPDLADEGFSGDTISFGDYIGWRESSFFVPVALFKTGPNTVQFSVEDDDPSLSTSNNNPPKEPSPLAIKDAVFQLSCPNATTSSSDNSSPAAPDAPEPSLPPISVPATLTP